MKLKRKIAAALLGVMAVVTVFPAGVANATEVNSYTYNYDYWELEYESPDAYQPVSYTDGAALGTKALKSPTSLFTRDNSLYVVDSGNNRILELLAEDTGLTLVREITGFTGETKVLNGEEPVLTFNAPQDVYVAENGDMYITDQANYRILHLDKDCNLIKEMLKPDSPLLDADNPFEPNKIVVDRSGRMFVLAKNVNKGVMQFEEEGNFVGFIGASEVVFSMADMIKKTFSTKAQRDQMVDFVPTEYNNLFIDNKSFIYCTTEVFDEWDLEGGSAKPIRKLNSLGGDILIRNGGWVPCGDWDWGDAAGMSGPSRIVDITAMDDETYYVVDRVRGHIFGYDEQGHLLYAFGGPGNQLGYFTYPIAIEHVGTDLYILDTVTGGITRFTRTEFGSLIHSALDEYDVGNYEGSAQYWEEVLAMNGNYELAYIGIGRSYLRQQDYKTAMEYFKVMRDDDNYSRAWKYYRKDWIENNLGYVIIVLVVLGFIPVIIRKIKMIRWEAKEQYEFESENKNK